MFDLLVDRFPMPRFLRSHINARRRTYRQLFRFAESGVVGTIVHTTLFSLIYAVMLDRSHSVLANTIAAFLGLTAVYLMARFYVFEGGRKEKVHVEALLFYVLGAITLVTSNAALWIGRAIAGHDLATLANLGLIFLGVMVSWGFRFFLSRRYIFHAHLERPAVDTATEVAHMIEEAHEHVPEAAVEEAVS